MISIIQMLNKVSTPPNKTSYYWKNSLSILSWLVLHIIYWERCLSILQWLKYAYRKSHSDSKDQASKRPNVPSYVVEIYYIAVSALIITLAILFQQHPVALKIIAWYFCIDSAIWVLYYFFFRRFYEEKYAIMHTLEYIVCFPLVLIIQALAIHIISDVITVPQSFSMLINPNMGTPLAILVLSVVYVAVIFGLIISNLPNERIKEKGDYAFHIVVIGYGQVVKDRLQIAIENANDSNPKEYLNVIYYSPDIANPQKIILKGTMTQEMFMPILPEDQQAMEGFQKDVLRSNIIWIATPPTTHLQYLEKYKQSGKLIVVEKPLTVFRNEYSLYKDIYNEDWDKVFCLSYYLLEKALPLTFLFRPLSFYEKYLDFYGLTRTEVLDHFLALGTLKKIDVVLNEDIDTRDWAFNPVHGGQLFETFIHPLSIAVLATGNPPDGKLDVSYGVKENGQYESIYLTGNCGHCQATLSANKNAGKKSRTASLSFENGIIDMDMDSQELTIIIEGIEKAKLSVAKKYNGKKYAVQLDMVMSCYYQAIIPRSIDCSDIQFVCLDWLFNHLVEYKALHSKP